MSKICIAGSGSWGTALAVLMAANGQDAWLWGRIEDGIREIREKRSNQPYLPGVAIPDRLQVCENLEQALHGARFLVVAVPAQAVRGFLEQIQELLPPGIIIVNVAKGLEIGSGLRISQIYRQVLEDRPYRYAVLSGPSHAEEVARFMPTAITVAAEHPEDAVAVQDAFMNPSFRVYTNSDVAGVELGGSLKNIIALASGISYGLGYGDNTAAALLTRGLQEIIRMGVALGGDPRTFTGLSGLGDLVVTCGSRHSRNRRAGEMIGGGCRPEEAMKAVGMVVEGIYTTRAVYELALDRGVDMPICQACYNVLYNKANPADEVGSLMQREKKNEIEQTLYFVLDPPGQTSPGGQGPLLF